MDPYLCVVCGHNHGPSEPCPHEPSGWRTIAPPLPCPDCARLRADLANAYAQIQAIGAALAETGVEVPAIVGDYPGVIRALAAEKDRLQEELDGGCPHCGADRAAGKETA